MDRMSIVSYSTDARIEVNLINVTKTNKEDILKKIEAL